MGAACHPDGADGGQDGSDAASRGHPAVHQPSLWPVTVEGNRLLRKMVFFRGGGVGGCFIFVGGETFKIF